MLRELPRVKYAGTWSLARPSDLSFGYERNMILMIIVGIYALAAGKIRFTRTFQLTGQRARSYGLTLLVLAIPATLGVNLVVRPMLPAIILSNRAVLSIVNVIFLAAVMFGLAVLFRDGKTPAAPASTQAERIEPPQQ